VVRDSYIHHWSKGVYIWFLHKMHEVNELWEGYTCLYAFYFSKTTDWILMKFGFWWCKVGESDFISYWSYKTNSDQSVLIFSELIIQNIMVYQKVRISLRSRILLGPLFDTLNSWVKTRNNKFNSAVINSCEICFVTVHFYLQ